MDSKNPFVSFLLIQMPWENFRGKQRKKCGFGVERTHIVADRKLGVGGAGERGTGIRREGTEVPEDRAQSIDGGREISVVDSAPGLSGNGPAETTDLRT
jgi:hypothetical protein